MKVVIDPDKPFRETGLRLLADQFHKVLAHENGTIEGKDIEELHQMRVGARRVRALLDIFGPALPEDTTSKLASRSAQLARRLGRVRDLDVQLDHLQGLRKDLGLLDDDATEVVRKALAESLGHWRKKLLRYLNGKKYRRFKDRLTALVKEDKDDGSHLAGS